MNSFHRAIGLLALLAALASCSYVIPLRAGVINGRLAFVVAEDAPRQPGTCITHLTVSNQQGETMWEFEQRPLVQTRGCPPWQPLLYGHVPAGTVALVPARRLEPDEVHVLYGDADAGSIHVAFRLNRRGRMVSVENLDWGSSAAQRANAAGIDWRGAQYQAQYDLRQSERRKSAAAKARAADRTEPPPARGH